MKRDQVLDIAGNLINGDRQEQYGTAKENFGRIAQMWSAYLGRDVTEPDVAVMMTLLKCARLAHQKKDDSFIDGVGYLALASELNDG